ncbi:MAG: LiaF-related protein [Vicingaceae bacterium]
MFDSRIFWGGLIILIGLSIILNAVFKINFPFFKVFIALVIIYFGFRLLFGSFGFQLGDKGNEESTIFGSQKVHVESISDNLEYNAVFGSQYVDLSQAVLINDDLEVEVNSVFGSIKVNLPDNVNVRLKASSAFGSVRTSEGEMVSFGDTKKSFSKGENPTKNLYVKANAVFGSVDLR